MVEQQEERIEEWYFDKKIRDQVSLRKYLCEDHVLKGNDVSCLDEVYTGEKYEDDVSKSKGDRGKPEL